MKIAQSELKVITVKHKRDVQSMLDKHTACIEKNMMIVSHQNEG